MKNELGDYIAFGFGFISVILAFLASWINNSRIIKQERKMRYRVVYGVKKR